MFLVPLQLIYSNLQIDGPKLNTSVRTFFIRIKEYEPFTRATANFIELLFNTSVEAQQYMSYIPWGRLVGDYSRRYVIILNPFGGEREASKIFDQTVKPMCDNCNFSLITHVTTRSGHAKEITSSLKSEDKYDGIIIIGGDGLLNECVNGLLTNTDLSIRSIPMAIIPAGTSNATARSLGMSDPVWATFCLIKGSHKKYDAILYEQGQNRLYGHFVCMWGLFADIDIGADQWRFLGRARIFMSSFLCLLKLAKYKAEINYIDASEEDLLEGNEEELRYRTLFEDSSKYKTLPFNEYYSFLAMKHPFLDRDFIVSESISAENSRDLLNLFVLPVAKDGIRRIDLLTALIKCDGRSIHSSTMASKHIKARACMIKFREKERTLLDVDGELLTTEDIYMESVPDALTFIIPP